MNKLKATAKAIREMPEPKVSVGYCEAHYLLSTRPAFAYTCGVYGWNFDAHDLDGLIVTTGYRNTIGPNVSDIAAKYEEQAETVRRNYPKYITYDEMTSELERLVRRFRAEALARVDRPDVA